MDNNITKARLILAQHLRTLGRAPSCWYIISTSGDELALSSRLGFHSKTDYWALLIAANLAGYVKRGGKLVLDILRHEWDLYVKNHDLSPGLVEYTTKVMDLGSMIRGTKQHEENRQRYHLLRIGRKVRGYATHISKQVDDRTNKLITKTPALPGLRSAQRRFTREIQTVVADTIVDHSIFFHDAMEMDAPPPRKQPPTQPVPAMVTPTSRKVPPTTLASPTPQTKSNFSTPSVKRAQQPASAEQPAKKKQRYDDLDKCLQEVSLDNLLAQAITRQQEKLADNTVLMYKDPRNSNRSVLVRVPQNSSDKSSINTVHGSTRHSKPMGKETASKARKGWQNI